MGYLKADEVLPVDLLSDIQNHIDGVYIYIPRKESERRAWGSVSRRRAELSVRNQEIFAKYSAGSSVIELACCYYLSEKTIYKIIAKMKVQE